MMERESSFVFGELTDRRHGTLMFELRAQDDPGDRVRYIGSKARLADAIAAVIGIGVKPRGRLHDLFAGTGSVARACALRGWRVLANDYLKSSALVTKARLLARQDVSFQRFGGYSGAIEVLNSSSPFDGPVFSEYSPSGCSRSGHVRKYFTVENGRQIDGVRRVIAGWSATGAVTQDEADLLISDLLAAANGVANIAGTYGCFLSNWSPASLRPIRLNPRRLLSEPLTFGVTVQDAFAVQDLENDVLYVDPPYTKRQYAAYYHLLETIAIGDHPEVAGKTGLRSWEHKSSPFCYKRRALEAFVTLLRGKRAREIYVSYSSEGHVSLEVLVKTLSEIGRVTTHVLSEVTRYAPNATARRNSRPIQEYLVAVTRS
jgi:adenine-specific DNA-methyltransferase